MKKSAFIAAFAAGLLGLAACSEQEVTTAPEAPEAGNTGFTIRATVDATKTSVDNYAVSWDEGDNMSILINNGQKDELYDFTWTGEGDKFSSESFKPSAGVNYIWYALFPYDSHFTSLNDDYSSAYVNIPAKSGLMQKAPGDMSHLANMPLYGYAETKGEVVPEIKMHHLTSVIQLSIANNLSEDLDIFSIGLDNNSGALLSGTFYVNCESGEILKSDTETQVHTYTDVTLGLSDGTVKAGETGVFYIPVAAATIDTGKDLVFTITDNNKGKAIITKNLASGLTFNPGRYRRTSITIDANTEFEAPSQIEEVTVADFLGKTVSADVYYRLTGTVTNIKDTKFGNFDLTDETGTVYVYGLTATKVQSNDQSFSSLNIEEGDLLTLEGVRAEYKGTAQVGGPAYFISVVKPVKFAVDPSALVFPADGGSLAATATATNFTGDVNISAVSENSHFTATVSGTTITVTAPANTGSEEITGEITVTATDGNSTKTATIAVSQASTATKSTTFVFNTTAGIQALGLDVPAASNGTNVERVVSDCIILKGDKGTNENTYPRVWNSSGTYNFRVNKNNTITFSIDGGTIKGISFDAGTIKYLSTDEGTLTGTNWKGSATTVTFTNSDAGRTDINTITVTYEGGVAPVEPVALVMSNITCTDAEQHENSLTFSWTAVENASGYQVSTDGGNNYGEVQSELTYTWSGLAAGREYTIYVKAVGDGTNYLTSEAKSQTGKTKASESGESSVVYTLNPAEGSNNNYANNCDVTIGGITWNVTGNSTLLPWRLGGKSITKVDRAIYSKKSLAYDIEKIEVTHGAASSITVNSMTVIVATDSDFKNVVSTLTPEFKANATVTVERPSGADWSNCYYKFVYNVTVSGSSNKFVEFTKAVFIGE